MKSLFTSSKKYVIIESPSKKLMYGTKRAARGDIMVKKEMIAMLLAGGQGSRLGVLTQKVAKPAVSFGGKYRIIDFPLSNCINSGVDTVGVLTQYQPLRLNAHIGIGIPWDLDRNVGGVTVLPPYERSKGSDWYTGTANAIYQNLEYMESYNPEYVLILSGDREKELYGRYEESAYFYRLFKLLGHPDVTLYELGGFDHGSMCAAAFPLAVRFIRDHEKK